MPRMPQAPPPGVVRSATPEATPGRWWDMNNMRWRGGVLQPIGGNVLLPGTGVSDTPRDVLTWHDKSYTRWAAFGTDSKLYAYNFSLQTLHDITPTGVGPLNPPGAPDGYGLGYYGTDAYGTSRDPGDIGPQDVSGLMGDMWSLATFGELLLVVPTQDGRLFVWNPETPTTLPTVVASAPTNNRAVTVTDQRSAVLLGAGGDPRNIAWSDTEDYTVWAPDITNLAGSKYLVTQALAFNAVKVPQGILIFTSNDVHLMNYVGPPYAYGISVVANGCGPISLRAPIAIGSYVAWPGVQSFWVFNGNVIPLICDVGDWFYSLVNRSMAGRIFGSPNPAFAELWWDWPDEGSSECNRYIVLGFVTPGLPYAQPNRPWMIGERARTAGDPAGTMDLPIMGGVSGDGGGLFLHEYGTLSDGVSRAASGAIYAETGAIELGEGDNRFDVTQIVFDAASTPAGPNDGGIGFRFFVREQPYDQNEHDTGLYTAIHNGLVDCRFSGRTARMRIEALNDQPWALGKPRLVVRKGGRR